MTFLFSLAAAAFGVFAWLAHGVWRIGAISHGPRIDHRPGTALVLIDLQEVFWQDGPYQDGAKRAAQAAIADEINAAQAAGWPIIAVRQEWSIPSTKAIARLTMRGQAVAGTTGLNLAAPFADRVDYVLVKPVQDAFHTGALDRLLADLDVGELRLVGLDLNHCILKTALAARNRGFSVVVIRDGTLAARSAERSLAQMDAHGVAIR